MPLPIARETLILPVTKTGIRFTTGMEIRVRGVLQIIGASVAVITLSIAKASARPPAKGEIVFVAIIVPVTDVVIAIIITGPVLTEMPVITIPVPTTTMDRAITVLGILIVGAIILPTVAVIAVITTAVAETPAPAITTPVSITTTGLVPIAVMTIPHEITTMGLVTNVGT